MIYLDHHAAAPLETGVAEAMDRVRRKAWANPSSVHAAGRLARAELEQARARVAQTLGARPADIVLTSGGTEACNLGVRGLAAHADVVVTSDLEHPAVTASVARLERAGMPVTRLAVADGKAPSPDALEQALCAATGRALVALQWVNHETGTLAPMHAYAELCARHDALLVVDGCQALGKLDVGVEGLAALAVAASKIGGPAGAGALWVDRSRVPEAIVDGGAQERGRRPGTPDVATHAGFAAACARLPERLAAQPGLRALRDRLEGWLRAQGAVVNGDGAERVGTVTNVSVPRWRGDMLVAALDVEGLCASSGAACSSGLGEPSPVLRALYPEQGWRAESALRLSLGPSTRESDVEGAVEVLARVLSRA